MSELILANARLIGEEAITTGSLTVVDGVIADIAEGARVPVGAIDCGGDFLSPGLIELHTDNLERHVKPRPAVRANSIDAVLAHDGELASTGITTVFDALRIGSVVSKKYSGYGPYAQDAAKAINQLSDRGQLKIDHFLHLRAEVCSETLEDELASFRGTPRVAIMSLMDHSPGQRQFRDTEQLRVYLKGKHNMSDEQVDQHFINTAKLHARVAERHRDLALKFGQEIGAVLASHDDTTAEDVELAVATNVGLAEFPTTMEAAEMCNANEIAVMMGAPNLMRGSSHSGNVSALDLVPPGWMQILSSDYVPSSLLRAAVKLGLILDDMAAGMATVTAAPARVSRLTDRGVLATGMRADLLRFTLADDLPLIRGVWSGGRQVA